jgi:hypothetical protein
MAKLILIRISGVRSSSTIDDLRDALVPVCQQLGEAFGVKALMRQEGEVLLLVLGELSLPPGRINALVTFINDVDPIAEDGWDQTSCDAYVCRARSSLDVHAWLDNVLVNIDGAQRQVVEQTRQNLFRTWLLRAVIAFALTGLEPNHAQCHATG